MIGLVEACYLKLIHFPLWFAVDTCILVNNYCNSFMVTDTRRNAYVAITRTRTRTLLTPKEIHLNIKIGASI